MLKIDDIDEGSQKEANRALIVFICFNGPVSSDSLSYSFKSVTQMKMFKCSLKIFLNYFVT